MAFRKIGVVGAGTMGNGIAQAFAQSGFDVVMSDVAQAALDRAMATISGSYDRLINKEKMTAEQKAAALGRIKTATELAALKDADLIIEAATENLELKLKIFKQLDELAKADAVIASNTSSICAAVARFSPSAKIASLIIGQSMRFTTKPGLFLTCTGDLPTAFETSSTAA